MRETLIENPHFVGTEVIAHEIRAANDMAFLSPNLIAGFVVSGVKELGHDLRTSLGHGEKIRPQILNYKQNSLTYKIFSASLCA